MSEVVVCFGTALRQLRERQGWSQETLAEHAQLNRSYVGELERGQAIPSLATVDKLALALSVKGSHLIASAEELSFRRNQRALELMAISG